MNNYRVKLDLRFKISEIVIRGSSQEDAEKYVIENLHTDEFSNVNLSGKTKVIKTIAG